jgi:hypothetical protein
MQTPTSYPTASWLFGGLLALEIRLRQSNWLGYWHEGYAVLVSVGSIGLCRTQRNPKLFA